MYMYMYNITILMQEIVITPCRNVFVQEYLYRSRQAFRTDVIDFINIGDVIINVFYVKLTNKLAHASYELT